jgi:hypothetical protein
VLVLCFELGIEMPESFPCDQFTRLRQMSRDRLTRGKPRSWVEAVRASNLIGWRYRTFVESVNRAISMPRQTPEDNFLQEQMLFLGVGGATSCVEAMGYATYALASDATVLAVPFDKTEQRDCSPRTVAAMLKRRTAAAST